MSFEEALKLSAASQEKLAAAMDRYASVMERIADAGIAFVGQPGSLPEGAAVNTPANTDKPAGNKRGPKPTKPAETKPAETADTTDTGSDEGDDPWGDDVGGAEEVTYTAADIRELILKVRDKGGEKKNAEAAKAILTKLGVKSMSEIKEADYAKAADLCNKALGK